MRRSSLSKLLFATVSFDAGGSNDIPFDRSLVSSLALAHRFRAQVSRTADRISAYLADARACGEAVAVYVPGRFVNYAMLAQLPLQGVRFFDDSPALLGRFFPGIPIAVEDGAALVRSPCPRVLIMSTSFGAKIKTRLLRQLAASTKITILDELT